MRTVDQIAAGQYLKLHLSHCQAFNVQDLVPTKTRQPLVVSVTLSAKYEIS